MNPSYQSIPRYRNLSSEIFEKQFKFPGLPVVIENFYQDWPAAKLWNDHYFSQKIGQNIVSVFDAQFAKPGGNYMSHSRKMTFNDFLVGWRQGNLDQRMFLFNLKKQAKNLLADVKIPTLTKGFSKNFFFMFLGAKGSVTPNHYDIDLAHVFHLTFQGKKTIYLFPPSENEHLYRHPFTVRSYIDPVNPDYQKFPQFQKANGYQVTVMAGDTLFIPSGYWHHVIYDESSLSLSLRCRHHDWRQDLKGKLNIVFMQIFDRSMNFLFNREWFKWKEKRALINSFK
jgi:hypothetical protein